MCSILEDYHAALEILTEEQKLIQQQMAEKKDALRMDAKQKTAEFLGISAERILHKWFQTMKECCAQGGYGHAVSWNNVPETIYPYSTPHHWVCPVEKYDLLRITEEIQLAKFLLDCDIEVAPTAQWERWGN